MSKDYSNIEGLIGNVKESIRNAYDKGYKQGEKDGYDSGLRGYNLQKTTMLDKSNFSREQYNLDLQTSYDCGYQRGLDDVWECCRKIVGDMVEPHFESGYMVDIFRCESAITAMTNNSPSEAIAKIKEYEEKQKADSNKVTRQSIIKSQLMDIVNGQKNPVTADEIAEVLEQLKEGQDETK